MILEFIFAKGSIFHEIDKTISELFCSFAFCCFSDSRILSLFMCYVGKYFLVLILILIVYFGAHYVIGKVELSYLAHFAVPFMKYRLLLNWLSLF